MEAPLTFELLRKARLCAGSALTEEIQVVATEYNSVFGVFSGMGCESTTRELAQRLSGNDEILLLWKPLCEQVEIAVRDVETGIEFHLEVAPGSALDAFHHPYAYAAALAKRDG